MKTHGLLHDISVKNFLNICLMVSLCECVHYLQSVTRFTTECHHLIDHISVSSFNSIGWDHWFWTSGKANRCNNQ